MIGLRNTMNNSTNTNSELQEKETLQRRLTDLSGKHAELTAKEVRLRSEHRMVSKEIDDTTVLLEKTKFDLERAYGVADTNHTDFSIPASDMTVTAIISNDPSETSIGVDLDQLNGADVAEDDTQEETESEVGETPATLVSNSLGEPPKIGLENEESNFNTLEDVN